MNLWRQVLAPVTTVPKQPVLCTNWTKEHGVEQHQPSSACSLLCSGLRKSHQSLWETSPVDHSCLGASRINSMILHALKLGWHLGWRLDRPLLPFWTLVLLPVKWEQCTCVVLTCRGCSKILILSPLSSQNQAYKWHYYIEFWVFSYSLAFLHTFQIRNCCLPRMPVLPTSHRPSLPFWLPP